jgi:hypothetical protein
MRCKLRRLERAALGPLMTLLAFVVERQVLRAVRPLPPKAFDAGGEAVGTR